KGERYVAPAFAARMACPALKINVQLVRIPRSEKYLMALIPSLIIGTFTTMLGCKAANFSPSLTMPSKSVLMTSALTSPSTISQMVL
ncbi:MAG: hypothetical protein RLZZ47_1075, partial [Bacteroidota bacterium]